MREINCAGNIPQRIIAKANSIIISDLFMHKGWKKLSCSSGLFSFRLDSNYRILRSDSGDMFIGNHDFYERKIKSMK